MGQDQVGQSGSTGSGLKKVDESAYSPDVLPVLVCRPVDWSELAELAPGEKESPVYPGSVRDHCRECQAEVWVGPKGQELLEKRGAEVAVLCFLCGIVLDRMQGGLEVKSLNNTFEKK